jgi:hypothetical protein
MTEQRCEQRKRLNRPDATGSARHGPIMLEPLQSYRAPDLILPMES